MSPRFSIRTWRELSTTHIPAALRELVAREASTPYERPQ